jgi:drug/metabolite transporter (DMT)-like permease
MTPVVLRGGIAQLRTTVLPLHGLRTVLTYIAILLWFLAATEMPVGDFFALQFTNPLFTIACAVLFLRERVDAKSWVAALIGFAGVLLILRPGTIPVTLGALAALGSAAAYAAVNTTIKVI